MINATPDPNRSWPGDVHALILSKLIQTNIVMVDNLLKGLIPSFDTSGYIEIRLINLKRNLFDLAGAKNGQNLALETFWAYF